MAEQDNTLQFGRVIYVEPNNDIEGTGRGTNFTFKPEDYSILVDLQVDVVDRYAYNGSSSNESIQYTLEWDAKGTKTSMFKGTNGMLTTKALNTSFDEIANNYNQEAIGINSIDIRYNSWNYPEITIQFTDIRGASLLSTADYTSSVLVESEKKNEVVNNFANSFFSTFFRFPYPRYTLIVKGFYGRPVSYSLCVNDFKTKFNSSTGNFDVTVSFIGYMYGIFTDIPMRLLLAAPYSSYKGREYWEKQRDDGVFVYQDGSNTPMVTLIELEKLCDGIPSKIKEMKGVIDLFNEKKEIETRKETLSEIKTAFNNFKNSFKKCDDGVCGDKYVVLFTGCDGEKECTANHAKSEIVKDEKTGESKRVYYVKDDVIMTGGNSSAGYVSLSKTTYVTCPDCNGTGFISLTVSDSVDMGGDTTVKKTLWKKISDYNGMSSTDEAVPYIDRINNEENAGSPTYGYVAYSGVTVENTNEYILQFLDGDITTDSRIFNQVSESDKADMLSYLRNSGLSVANQIDNSRFIAVSIIRVTEFNAALNGMLKRIDELIENINERIKQKQNECVKEILKFDVTLKNVVDMCLAHLDTFMTCMYYCMDMIKDAKNGQGRLFSDVDGLSVGETDVLSKVDPGQTASDVPRQVYLPPFFAFKRKNPKTDMYEDEWIGADKRFADKDVFQEIQLIDGLINGTLLADQEASSSTSNILNLNSEEIIYDKLGDNYLPTFINDYYLKRNPYRDAFGDNGIEGIIMLFAFRCMLATIYSRDYPNVGNRFDNKDDFKLNYFDILAETDAENFKKSPLFDSFRLNENAKNAFKNFTWSDFKSYITGEKCSLVGEKSEKYYSGYMTSPLFTKDGNDLVVSYGNQKNGEYVVPLNFTNPMEPVDICNDIYCGTTIERNGFGIDRSHAMPVITITIGGTDSEDQSAIESSFNERLKKGDIRQIGWYFKNKEIWKKYYSGVPIGLNNTKLWFPTLFAVENIKLPDYISKETENLPGILYNGQSIEGGDEVYANRPHKDAFDSARSFFVEKNNNAFNRFFRWLVGETTNEAGTNSKYATDSYVEKVLIDNIINNPETVTVLGLLCGDESLFESEFYASQTSDAARAFLFLHSLPTSEYGCLAHAVSTIIKKTYTPAVTNIPYADALFIGALYARESGKFAVTFPDRFESTDAKHLITYESGQAENGEAIRRPLNPILKEKPTGAHPTYLSVISSANESTIDNYEKQGFINGHDDNLRYWMDTEKGMFAGFWGVTQEVKDEFINLFLNFVNGDFKEIQNALELRGTDNVTRYGANGLIDVCNRILAYKGNSTIKNSEDYNSYIHNHFSTTLTDNHVSLGVAPSKRGLLTMFRPSQPIIKKITGLMTTGCEIKIAFPRILMTRDMFAENERERMKIREKIMESAWKKFHDGIVGEVDKKDSDDKENSELVKKTTPSSVPDTVKLSLYESLKNIHDKWLISTKIDKYKFDGQHSVRDKFHYINSFHERIGDTIFLNLEELPNQIRTAKFSSNDNACSLYSFMYDIANQARVQLLALPVFNDMSNPDYVRDVFRPIPYDELDVNDVNTETEFVFMYPEEASKQVSLPNDFGSENDQYKFVDDSFTLVTESGLENNGGTTPSTFWNTREDNVPVFGVTFAKQNQSFFKNISVSMDNPRTTEVSINNMFLIADKYNGGNSQVTALGQDLFSIYSNYSFECSVEMMGCACIMPLMYFQLNNIPMFKGTYIIYNVSHSITPGNMTTTFGGQRLSRYRKKRNDESLSIFPNDNAFLGNYDYKTGGNAQGDYCYDCVGRRMENEETYMTMANISGVNDKSALRAVEYAESHNTGGFFSDNKLKVYYDPYMNEETGHFSPGHVSDTFSGNLERINAKSEGKTDKITVKDGGSISSSVAERCTYGAFGIPGKWYSYCGVSSVKDLWDGCAAGFGAQGTYFATLLKNNPDMKNALQNKDWKKFAELYKKDVYMPGDSGYANYIKDLETGYYMADTASADNADKYVNSPGKDFDIEQDTNLSELDVRAAIASLNKATKVVHYVGQSGYKKINTTEKNSEGKLYTYKGKTLRDYGCTPGTKPENFPLGLCATYVKGALDDGGYRYHGCDGGKCGQEMLGRGWAEIYTSRAQDDWLDNSKWKPGDVMTIDATDGLSKYGHIAMWNGSAWVSDFKQANCICYSSEKKISTAKSLWGNGGYHFFRYKNAINM